MMVMVMKNRSTTIIISIIFMMVFFLSVGYAALNSTLDITGSVTFEASTDIYIDSILNKSFINNASENYNPNYNANNISVSGNLPELKSEAIYYLKIYNNTSNSKKLNTITTNTNNNENTTYETAGLKGNITVAARSSSIIELRVKYNSSVISLPTNTAFGLSLTFNFATPSDGGSEIVYQNYVSDSVLLDLRGYRNQSGTTWTDENGKVLTLVGNASRDASSNSYVFDGNGDYATSTQAYIPSTNDFTAEIYLNVDDSFNSLTSADQAILSQVSDTSNSAGRFKINLRKNITNGVSTSYQNGAFVLFWNNSYANTNVFYSYNDSITTSTKYGITITRTNNKMYFYVNGVYTNEVTIDAAGSLAPISQNNLKLAKFNNSGTQYFHGKIYAVRIYNRALTANEILSNYNADVNNYTERVIVNDNEHNLYDKMLVSSYVSTGDGLYLNGDNLTFKGSNPNNILQIESETYRIMNANDNGIQLLRTSNPIATAYDTYTEGVDRGTYCSNYQASGCSAWTTYDTLTTGTYTGTVNAEASINTYLNTTFYNSLSTTLKSLMKSLTLNVGAVDESYTYDLVSTEEQAKTWTGNVGLMTLKNVLDASLTFHALNTTVNDNYINYTNFTGHYWTSTQSTLDNWDVWIMSADSRKIIAERRASRTDQTVNGVTIPFYALPVIYINKDIKVTGSGTTTDPYIYSST
jgi:hypothetical protein